MRTQKRFFVNEYGPTAGKVRNLLRGHKDNFIVKLFSDVCLFSSLWNT